MKKLNGLTLIELLIGIIIIAIISVASFEFFRYCQRFIVESEIRLGAANFARETMEWRMWDADIATTAGWVADTALPTGAEFASDIRDNYNGTREYNVSQDAGGNYKVVRVKVNWTP